MTYIPRNGANGNDLMEAAVDDVTLVNRAVRGDKEAFGKLYLKHRNLIYAICVRMVHRSEIAEELVHESFLKANRGIKKFEYRAKFSSWLTRIAINECLMKLRQKEDEITDSISPDPATESEQSQFGGVRDSRLENTPTRTAIERLIEDEAMEPRLSPRCKAVLLLMDVRGCTIRDVAIMWGRTESCVKAVHHRAIGTLQLRAITLLDIPYPPELKLTNTNHGPNLALLRNFRHAL